MKKQREKGRKKDVNINTNSTNSFVYLFYLDTDDHKYCKV